MHETTLIYTETLVKRAVLRYWRRTLGVGYAIALLMVIVSFGALVVLDTDLWILAALGGTIVLAVGFSIVVYAVHYSSSMGRFRRMDVPAARFIADEDTFAFVSPIGEAKLQWSIIREVWRYKDLWLILYAQGGFNVIPIAGVTQDMRDFIEQRVAAAGGKLR